VDLRMCPASIAGSGACCGKRQLLIRSRVRASACGQMTVGQSLLQNRLQMFRLLPCPAMADCIIGIAFERNAWKRPTHPR
jgi:hypothetical protein